MSQPKVNEKEVGLLRQELHGWDGRVVVKRSKKLFEDMLGPFSRHHWHVRSDISHHHHHHRHVCCCIILFYLIDSPQPAQPSRPAA